jgi:hypothetical protein
MVSQTQNSQQGKKKGKENEAKSTPHKAVTYM